MARRNSRASQIVNSQDSPEKRVAQEIKKLKSLGAKNELLDVQGIINVQKPTISSLNLPLLKANTDKDVTPSQEIIDSTSKISNNGDLDIKSILNDIRSENTKWLVGTVIAAVLGTLAVAIPTYYSLQNIFSTQLSESKSGLEKTIAETKDSLDASADLFNRFNEEKFMEIKNRLTKIEENIQNILRRK